jgi:predicted nucleotidyltransferase component of viral defense system
MATESYKKQVKLLLAVLPEIAKEQSFALHGGTAINLFVRDMPRLSVDIDLTYIPLDDRVTSLKNISEALERCKERIQKVLSNAKIQHKKEEAKLIISDGDSSIKIEVNTINRGIIKSSPELTLCQSAQNDFELSCTIAVVPLGQLFGGKIVAALDRQHPRDLFDVKYLLEKEGFTPEIKEGFLLLLLSSERPLYEILFPNLLDQRSTLENQFAGMSNVDFSYDDYEKVRAEMIATIHTELTKADKDFLLSVKRLEPDWTKYNFENFPAVKWKLQNLLHLKNTNPEKYKMMYDTLEKYFTESGSAKQE